MASRSESGLSSSGRYSGLVVKTAHRSPDELKTTEESGNESETDEEEDSEDKDSPAFRLRPRRSTPRPSLNAGGSSQGKKYSLLTAKATPEFQARMAKLKYHHHVAGSPAKRKLFRSSSHEDSDEERIIRPPTPSRSLLEDMNLSVFAEKIPIADLEPSEKYDENYISVRIVFIVNDYKDKNEEQVLKLLAQEADHSLTVIDHTKPIVPLYLYGVYSEIPGASVGKFVEVLKFEVKAREDSEQSSFNINECDIPTLPYSIIVKDSKNPRWVPLVSVKDRCDPPADRSVLKVATQPFLSQSPTARIGTPTVSKTDADVKPNLIVAPTSTLESNSAQGPSPAPILDEDSESERELEIDISCSSGSSSLSSNRKEPHGVPVSVSIKEGSVSKMQVKNSELNFSNYFSSVKYNEARNAAAPVQRSSGIKSKATSITITSSSVTINANAKES